MEWQNANAISLPLTLISKDGKEWGKIDSTRVLDKKLNKMTDSEKLVKLSKRYYGVSSNGGLAIIIDKHLGELTFQAEKHKKTIHCKFRR